MLWFLRLFPLFRSLEFDLTACREAVQEGSSEVTRLNYQLESALADKEQLWKAMEQALDNERYALRMQVNHAVQKSGGGIPYPDSHALPAAAVLQPQESGPIGRSGRLMASEAMSRVTRDFIHTATERMNGKNG